MAGFGGPQFKPLDEYGTGGGWTRRPMPMLPSSPYSRLNMPYTFDMRRKQQPMQAQPFRSANPLSPGPYNAQQVGGQQPTPSPVAPSASSGYVPAAPPPPLSSLPLTPRPTDGNEIPTGMAPGWTNQVLGQAPLDTRGLDRREAEQQYQFEQQRQARQQNGYAYGGTPQATVGPSSWGNMPGGQLDVGGFNQRVDAELARQQQLGQSSDPLNNRRYDTRVAPAQQAEFMPGSTFFQQQTGRNPISDRPQDGGTYGGEFVPVQPSMQKRIGPFGEPIDMSGVQMSYNPATGVTRIVGSNRVGANGQIGPRSAETQAKIDESNRRTTELRRSRMLAQLDRYGGVAPPGGANFSAIGEALKGARSAANRGRPSPMQMELARRRQEADTQLAEQRAGIDPSQQRFGQADRNMLAQIEEDVRNEVGPAAPGRQGASEANAATAQSLFDRVQSGAITFEEAQDIARRSDAASPTGSTSTLDELDRLRASQRQSKERQGGGPTGFMPNNRYGYYGGY